MNCQITIESASNITCCFGQAIQEHNGPPPIAPIVLASIALVSSTCLGILTCISKRKRVEQQPLSLAVKPPSVGAFVLKVALTSTHIISSAGFAIVSFMEKDPPDWVRSEWNNCVCKAPH